MKESFSHNAAFADNGLDLLGSLQMVLIYMFVNLGIYMHQIVRPNSPYL
jgi:hypothetical protein